MPLPDCIGNKAGGLGSTVSAMGCGATFTKAEKLLSVGLAVMVGVLIWNFVAPANRRCTPDGCQFQAMRG